jgi:alpha-beta hydrolase superfamily lysophospholipase
LLVDFYGSGGSQGSGTSIGFHEAGDVTASYRQAERLGQGRPVVLYGASMGAAALLKAVGDDGLQPAGLVLEAPFDSLLGTVRHRFDTFGIPSFPLADLLVFWGGVQQGFDGRAFRPADDAARVTSPSLLISGEDDPWVRPEETRAIYHRLAGPKSLRLVPGMGHEPCLRAHPEEWRSAVRGFLDAIASPGES